jgi:hypothetical protein
MFKKDQQDTINPMLHATSGTSTLRLEKVGVRAFDFNDPSTWR